jgi:hypothetical protein
MRMAVAAVMGGDDGHRVFRQFMDMLGKSAEGEYEPPTIQDNAKIAARHLLALGAKPK